MSIQLAFSGASPSVDCPSNRPDYRLGVVINVQIQDDGALVWNGTHISRANFTDFLTEAGKENPFPLFLVSWNSAALQIVEEVLARIRARGFTVATNCEEIAVP